MTGKAIDPIITDIANPTSPVTLPPDLHFSDDRPGLETRMLLVGYAERLADQVRHHEPLQAIRDTIARITEITQHASTREIMKLANMGKPN